MTTPPPPPPGSSGGREPFDPTGASPYPSAPSSTPPASNPTPPSGSSTGSTAYGSPEPAPGQPVSPYGTPSSGPSPYGGAPQQGMPPEPYGGYGAGQPPQQNQDRTLSIISLVAGILAIPLCCCWGGGGLVGIAALITGYLGRQQAERTGDSQGGQLALIGMVLGGIAILLAVVYWVLLLIGYSVDDSWSNNTY